MSKNKLIVSPDNTSCNTSSTEAGFIILSKISSNILREQRIEKEISEQKEKEKTDKRRRDSRKTQYNREKIQKNNKENDSFAVI